jgi:hypothetical protein
MTLFNEIVLMLHFLGLAMGMSVTFGNIVMLNLITAAAPSEKAVLARFPPAISKVGRAGLALLWVTGLTMLYTRWNGLAGMPWQFHVKLTAVVVLTLVVIYLTSLEHRIMRGDREAAARVQVYGKLASLSALTAVIFAVLTIN